MIIQTVHLIVLSPFSASLLQCTYLVYVLQGVVETFQSVTN
jgi:hypothetical protein